MKRVLAVAMVLCMALLWLPAHVSAAETVHTFDATKDVAPIVGDTFADKDAIPEGTTFADGFFKVVGTVTLRHTSSKGIFCVELAKGAKGALEFTVTGTAKVLITVSSTDKSNTSAIALVDADGNAVENAEKLTTVTGTGATTLTYNDLSAGTYKIVTPVDENYKRNVRLMSAVVTESDSADPSDPSGPVELTKHTFSSLVDVTPGTDKDAIAAGTTYSDGFFTVFGGVTLRYKESKGGVYAVELSKNAGGGIMFVIPEGASADIVITVSSTDSENTSAVAIVAADGTALTNKEEISEVTGTSATTLTYENVGAGTYKILSPQSSYGRGVRLMTIDVAPHEEDKGNPGSGDIIALTAFVLVAAGMGLAALPRKKEN